MKSIYLFILFIGISIWTNNQVQAQACFSIASPGTSYAQTHQCNSFQATLVNCSAVTYDQAVWTLQINSSGNCAGPWGTWVSQTFTAPGQANPFTPTINATGVYCVKLDLYLAGVLVGTTTQNCIFQIFYTDLCNMI